MKTIKTRYTRQQLIWLIAERVVAAYTKRCEPLTIGLDRNGSVIERYHDSMHRNDCVIVFYDTELWIYKERLDSLNEMRRMLNDMFGDNNWLELSVSLSGYELVFAPEGPLGQNNPEV